ncbi:MAG: hypothetical protein ACRDOD_10200 [Streptosporangiaceae bacterium]
MRPLSDSTSACSAVTGGGPAAPAAALAAQLDAIHGVQGTVVVRLVPGLTLPGTFHDLGGDGNGHFSPVPASVMSCAQLATVPALGRCPAGAATAAFPAAALGEYGVFDGSILTGITWPAANVPPARLDTLGVDSISVGSVGAGNAESVGVGVVTGQSQAPGHELETESRPSVARRKTGSAAPVTRPRRGFRLARNFRATGRSRVCQTRRTSRLSKVSPLSAADRGACFPCYRGAAREDGG